MEGEFPNSFSSDGFDIVIFTDFSAGIGRSARSLPWHSVYHFFDTRFGDDGGDSKCFRQFFVEYDPVQNQWKHCVYFVIASYVSTDFFAYVLASIARGLLVGLGVYIVTLIFFEIPLHLPLWALLFVMLGSAILGALGLIAGIWADKFDQLAAFQNFIILPLSFLSGVFYTIHTLPAGWQYLSHLNPFFYIIDGFRYGFFGVSDISPYVSLLIVAICLFAISVYAIRLLKMGYKLRH